MTISYRLLSHTACTLVACLRDRHRQRQSYAPLMAGEAQSAGDDRPDSVASGSPSQVPGTDIVAVASCGNTMSSVTAFDGILDET